MINFRKIPKELTVLGVAFRKNAARARADNEVSPVRQVLDMVRLRLGPGRLEPEDYYKMRVYRRDLSFGSKREFASQRALGLSQRWYTVTHDKLLAYLLLEQEGIPVEGGWIIVLWPRPFRLYEPDFMILMLPSFSDGVPEGQSRAVCR